MPSILFISTADQVRGPLVVALLLQMAQPVWQWQISSAGLRAQAAAGEQPVNRLVWRTMRAGGLDHFLQPSRPVAAELLRAADLTSGGDGAH